MMRHFLQLRVHLLTLISVLGIYTAGFTQTIRYVKPGGAGDGTSWSNASGNLQAMIDASPANGQVWVAAGTYKPTSGTDQNASFKMKNDVAIYGGFSGSETQLSERNFTTNVTVLSGDLSNNDEISGSGLNLKIFNNGENTYNVVANRYTADNPLRSTAVLDGFTIKGGKTVESTIGSNNSGGGMFNFFASPTLRNLNFVGNMGYYGGGMMNSQYSSPTLINVLFDRNLASSDGGAIYNFTDVNASLTNVIFTGNMSFGNFGGGGVFNGGNTTTFTDCRFEGNGATYGGAVTGIGSNTRMIRCMFANNTTFRSGGAIWEENGSLNFENSIFYRNRAGWYGGTIFNRNSTVNIKNCSLTRSASGINSGSPDLYKLSGVIYMDGANVSTDITNSIIWDNQNLFHVGVPSIRNSIVQGGWPGVGNSGNNPLFTNIDNPAGLDNVLGTSDDGLSLKVCSPAINAGDNSVQLAEGSVDLAKNPRRYSSGTIDLGAYEFQAASISISVGSNSPVCEGYTLQLSAVGGNSYSWSGPDSFSSTEQSPVFTSASISMSGGYSVSISDGTCTVSTSIFVSVSNLSVQASSNSPICSGKSLSLSTEGGSTYTWSGPSGYASNLQNPTRESATTGMSGIYSVTVSDGVCTASATTLVQVKSLPAVSAQSNAPVCVGSTLRLTALSDASSYTWTGPNSYSSLIQNPSLIANNSAGGEYSVVVSDGTCTASATTSVEVIVLPVVEASSNSPLCLGATLRLSAVGLSISSTWTGPNGFSSNQQSPTQSNINSAFAGVYSVMVSNGTCTAVYSTAVEVNSPSVQLSSNSPICSGSPLNLSSSGSGISFSWSGPNSFSSGSQNPSIANAGIEWSGTYSITVSDGTCTNTAMTQVEVRSRPTLSLRSQFSGCTFSSINLSVSGSSNAYTWTGPGGYRSEEQSPILRNVSASMAGNYTVMGSDGSCTSSAVTSVQVYFSPSLTASSNASVCVGGTVSLSASSNGSTFTWSGPNAFSSNEQNPAQSNANLTMSGRYTVMVSNANCVATATTSISVFNPVANVSSNSPVCAGSALNLSATGGSVYSWAGPGGYNSTLQNPRLASASPPMSGTYSATVRNAGGCTATGTVSVVVSPNVAPSITSLRVNGNLPNAQTNTATACTNAPVNLNITATNALTYSWRGPTGAGSGFTSSLVSPVTMPIASPRQGQYTVTVRNGCQVFNQRVINLQLINCSSNRLASAEDTDAIEMEINAYPNPVSKTLKVEVRLKEPAALQLRLLNSIGQESGTWQLGEVRDFHQTELNLVDLQVGVYLLEAAAGKQRAVKRVVKIQYE